jgi:nucleoside phosphorylase
MKRSRIPIFLSEMTAKYPRLATKFTHPGQHEDRLYQAEYEHVGESTCDNCDTSRLIVRDARVTNDPKVYYGVIGSGNSMIKHSARRDRLAMELAVLCFDLEAAGLMDHFPCLAIRGISDYADSHIYKRWQPYAAATAAAYAKELLSVLPVNQVTGIPPTVPTTSPQAGKFLRRFS